MNTSHVTKLGEWLKGVNKFGKYKLCWDSQTADKDGFNKCIGKNSTITVIKNKDVSNQVIGAFTDMPLQNNQQSKNVLVF